MGKARTVRCNPLANVQYGELLASVSRNVAGAIGILALFGCLALRKRSTRAVHRRRLGRLRW